MESGGTLTGDETQELFSAIEQLYGLRVSRISQLGGELDLNYKAVLVDGSFRFIRLSPEPVDAAATAWQNMVLRQLEQRPLSVAVPQLLNQRDGSPESTVVLGNNRFLLRLTTWVPGTSVSDLGATDRGFRLQLGGLAAEVIECLSPLNDTPSDENSHHWMVETSGASLRSTMDAVTAPHRRALIDRALAWFDEVEPHISSLPRSVVHQDLHDFNMLAERDENGHTRITGVVDFNDAVYTIRVAELAVASAYSALRQPDAFLAFSEVVEGYVSRSSLTDLELDLLYPLAVARLAVNASTWTQRASGTNAEYAESRMVATWPALEGLLNVSPKEATAQFHQLVEAVGKRHTSE